MSLLRYKGLIRGAFALAISYLQVAKIKDHIQVRTIVRNYLTDNGLDMPTHDYYEFIKTIVREAENVVYCEHSMDSALTRLSTQLNLVLI